MGTELIAGASYGQGADGTGPSGTDNGGHPTLARYSAGVKWTALRFTVLERSYLVPNQCKRDIGKSV